VNDVVNSTEELHFLIDYFTQSVEVTKGEVAKLAASDE
jgi:hypothetical protein